MLRKLRPLHTFDSNNTIQFTLQNVCLRTSGPENARMRSEDREQKEKRVVNTTEKPTCTKKQVQEMKSNRRERKSFVYGELESRKIRIERNKKSTTPAERMNIRWMTIWTKKNYLTGTITYKHMHTHTHTHSLHSEISNIKQYLSIYFIFGVLFRILRSGWHEIVLFDYQSVCYRMCNIFLYLPTRWYTQ